MLLFSKPSVKVKQNDHSDCGAAALVSVAAHAGIRASVSALRHLSGTDKTGTTIKGLIEGARAMGLGAEAFKGVKESLPAIPKPAILHLRKEDGRLHFIVLSSKNRRGFTIMDPADGALHRVTPEELCREWSGVIILFTFPKESIKRHSASPHLKELLKTIFAEWRIYPVATAISIASTLSMLAVALFVKELIDNVIPQEELLRLKTLSISLLLLTVTAVILSAIRAKVLLSFAIRIERGLTNGYLNHISHIPLPFYNTFKTGELTSRLTDIYRIRDFISGTLPETSVAVITLILSFILLFNLSLPLALLCSLFIPVYILLFILHDRVKKPLIKRVMERGATFQSYIIEQLRSMSTIKNFGIERESLTAASLKFNQLAEGVSKAGGVSIVAGSSAELTSRILSIAVLWGGGAAIISGRLSAGEMISFYTLTSLFTAPMQQMAASFSAFREGLTASNRLNDIISVEREEERISVTNGSEWLIEFRGVSFGYPGRALLFENLSFGVEKGEILLLKGSSGCGKSTVISLIMQHLTPTKGEILSSIESDGTLESFRKNIALVPQNPTLWGSSILECIVPGVQSLPESKELTTIIEELELDKMATRLPFGLSTHPGEGGVLLSRGEQQRVAYARAVMRRAPLLLLDEATASLDSHSERVIRQSVLKLRNEGSAILIISHDKRMEDIADSVIDMNLL